MQLSSWDKEELDDKLANRVQVSKRAVSKVVQAFDRLSQRNEKITLALKGEFDGEEAPNIDDVVRKANVEIQQENRNLQAINIQLHEKYHTISLKVEHSYSQSMESSPYRLLFTKNIISPADVRVARHDNWERHSSR